MISFPMSQSQIYPVILILGVTLAQVSVSCGQVNPPSQEVVRDGLMWRQTLMPRLDSLRQGDAGSPNNLGSGKQLATYMCPTNAIHVTVNPGIDKISKVAIMGAENIPGCSTYVVGSMYHLIINITDPLNPPCGIRRDVDGTLTAIVATQAFMNAYGGSDRMYTIQCRMGQKLMAQTTGTVIDGRITSGMAFLQDATMVKLEIRDRSATQQLTQATLGDMVVLHAQLMNTLVYKGMEVYKCMAYDSIEKSGDWLTILDKGCGTGDLIGQGKGFYHLPGLSENIIVSPPMPMFRFLKSPFVMVECEFSQLCMMDNKEQCDNSCKSGGIARKRRSSSAGVNSTVATLLIVPESETMKTKNDFGEVSGICVDQMAMVLTVVLLGCLVMMSTGVAVWFCTRWYKVKREMAK